MFFFFFKQKTAYEMQFGDWSSDVCSSDLRRKGKNPKPILVKGTHEPIISEEDYQKVQERLALEGKQPKWSQDRKSVV